ncbi:hypothetical protein [Larkinella humicola]|uniref:PepSY-associated transmembrane protein n=1 Tax=Larkinella humicola TaxID=2607654 RepID=A0A5N1JB52_9BACT|nr:hypothetical protein [Larkinella humicola]KAA9349897.1 hypothetical protein F0P93_20875 [Larkinella humicola]
MKLLFFSLILTIGTAAMAQSSLRTRISDDEKTLSIRIDGTQNGRKIHFNRAFDVSDMSALRKEMLKYRVYTSLGISPPLHEMPWVILTVLGVLVVFFTGLVLRFRPVKPARLRPL